MKETVVNVIDAIESSRPIRALGPEPLGKGAPLGIALGYEDPDDVNNRCRSIRRPVEDAIVINGL